VAPRKECGRGTVAGGGDMDRRSVLGLAAMAAFSTRALADAPSSVALAGDPLETIPLWPGTPPGGSGVRLELQLIERSPTPDVFHDRFAAAIAQPLLTVFRPDKPDGSALLVAPGGGYQRVVVDIEGFETGRRFNGSGVTVFVLRYRLPGEGWANGPDVPLQDAQRAMRIIRGRAAEFAIDPARIGVLGFSAGGHLAASLATRSDAPVYEAVDRFDALDARPAITGLMYPVISMIPPVAHPGSRGKLLGASPSEMLEIAYSPDRGVTPKTPPCFVALAADDRDVDPQNGLAMFQALRGVGVASELHVFEEGGHGFGLRRAEGKPAAAWPDLFLRWGARHGVFAAG
jgi:acetyl esterase/lipase